MNSRKIELAVGLFVCLTIASFLLLALKVANQGISGNGETYKLYAKFDNIGGLRPRAAVKVGGVKVGRVSEILLDPEDFIPVVTLEIDKRYDAFPDTSSVAIQTSGLLGEQFVGLLPGFSYDGIENLADGDFVEDTKSALVLEDLIGQFLFSSSDE